MKLVILLLFVSCVQFEESVEQTPGKMSANNGPFRFTTQASVMDTREYGIVDLAKIKSENPNLTKISIFSNSKDVFISLTKNEIAELDHIKVRKFNEQYFVKIETSDSRLKTIILNFRALNNNFLFTP